MLTYSLMRRDGKGKTFSQFFAALLEIQTHFRINLVYLFACSNVHEMKTTLCSFENIRKISNFSFAGKSNLVEPLHDRIKFIQQQKFEIESIRERVNLKASPSSPLKRLENFVTVNFTHLGSF